MGRDLEKSKPTESVSNKLRFRSMYTLKTQNKRVTVQKSKLDPEPRQGVPVPSGNYHRTRTLRIRRLPPTTIISD